MMLAGSAAGEKAPMFLLFREFSGPEWERTVEQLGEDALKFVYTYMIWLEEVPPGT